MTLISIFNGRIIENFLITTLKIIQRNHQTLNENNPVTAKPRRNAIVLEEGEITAAKKWSSTSSHYHL